MKVMVAAASKHEATWEIAEAIGRVLSEHGHTVGLHRLHKDEDYPDPSGFDAFVLGSGVYAGHWLAPARGFISGYQELLSRHPLWLFSSGPVGIVPRPSPDEAVNASAFIAQTGAREHVLFGGRIDRSRLGFAERALIGALGVSDGDNRDFAEVTHWASRIAADLTTAATETVVAHG